ncbi:hypothetical protein [Bacteroides pyogenes]|uniref:hypothetical protein n=1 Tax=Bacteroides pyogenes TaxID=310300 RepID=UPI002FD94569
MRKINVPIALIRECSRDKLRLECLALAIIIKRTFVNSTLYGVNVGNFRRTFGCSYKKAQKMIEAVKDCGLFLYNEEHDFLFAKSFKSKDVKHYGKGGKFRAMADFCKKIYESANTLRDVTRLLRETLLANVMVAQQRELLGGNAKQTQSNGKAARSKAPIALRKFAKSISMSKSSAGRYISKMAKDGKVSKSEIVAECVLPCYTCEKATAWMKKHPWQRLQVWFSEKYRQFTAWIIYGRMYSLEDGKLDRSFRNIIYTHKRRLSAINKPCDPLAYLENFNA